MPFVKRDSAGNIIASYAAEQDDVKEFVAIDDPAIVDFLDPKKIMERAMQRQQKQQQANDDT